MAVCLKIFLAIGFIAFHVRADYCPQRKESLIDKNRRCRKPCLEDKDCTAENKKCFCDEECGLSCLNEESPCSEPEIVANGHVRWSDLRWGSKAYYRCDESFALVGSRMRRCNADKQWGGNPPICEKGCLRPDDAPASYTIEGENGFRAGHSYNFSCRPGYYMSGSAERTCISAAVGWSDVNYTCQAVHCDAIGDVFNGELNTTMGNQFGSVATVQCHVGYRESSSGSMRCYPGEGNSFYGEWVGTLPSCNLITCENPEPLDHGIILNWQHIPHVYGTEISYRCDDGYKLLGAEIRRCNEDGEWGSKTLCIENFDCSFDDPNLCGYVENGWRRVLLSNNGLVNDFAMESESDDSILTSSAIPIGWTTQYMCLTFSYRIAQQSGILAVKEASAGQTLWESLPEDLSNRWLLGAANINAGSGVTFQFHATKPSVFVRNVTVTPEKCKFICSPPVVRENSHLKNEKSEWLMEDHASFQCANGLHSGHPKTFKIMETIITCRDTGRWSNPSPYCVKPACAVSHRLPGDVTTVNSQLIYDVGETARLKCDIGYDLIGNTTLTCVGMASWDKTMPECQIKSCGYAPDIPNGSPVSSHELHYGVSVEYECIKNDYYIERSSTIKCRFDGSFSRLPACRRRQRCVLLAIENGWTTKVERITYFHCKDMFELVGPNQTHCNPDGTWSGSVPHCQELEPTKKLVHENLEYLIFMQAELKTNYDGAQRRCNDIGSNLAIIYSNPLRKEIENQLKTVNTHYYHILFGLKKLRNGEHHWDVESLRSSLSHEKTSSTYRYWKFLEGYENCVAIERGGGTGDWIFKNYPWTTVSCNGRHGFVCQRDHPCHPKSCLNGGRCGTLGGQAYCSCPDRYTGKVCQRVVKCNVEDLDRMLTAHSQERLVPVGSKILVSCPDEYQLIGPERITCLRKRRWSSSDTPTWCQELSCSSPSFLPEYLVISSATTSERYPVKSEITLECPGDATLFGTPTAICGFDENWSEIAAVCKDTTCDHPDLPNFSFISEDSETSYTSGSSITLTCLEDRIIDGDPVWRCANGQWLQTDARCIARFCTVDPLLLGAEVEVRNYSMAEVDRVNFEAGDEITLVCKDGSVPVHWERENVDHTILCQKGGAWTTGYGEFDCK